MAIDKRTLGDSASKLLDFIGTHGLTSYKALSDKEGTCCRIQTSPRRCIRVEYRPWGDGGNGEVPAVVLFDENQGPIIEMRVANPKGIRFLVKSSTPLKGYSIIVSPGVEPNGNYLQEHIIKGGDFPQAVNHLDYLAKFS